MKIVERSLKNDKKNNGYYLGAYIISFALQYVMLFEIIYLEIMRPGFFIGVYQKQGYMIEKKLGMSQEDLKCVIDYMISYCKKGRTSENILVLIDNKKMQFFNARELQHLDDIYTMIKMNQFIVIVLIIIIVSLLTLLKRNGYINIIPKIFLRSECVLVGIMAVIILMALVNITAFVNNAHRIFFRNNMWIMNPVTDKIIYLFPTHFFTQIMIYLVVRVLVQWGAISCISVLFVKSKQKEKGK